MTQFGRRTIGEGPVPNRLMIIGDYPDRESARTGRPFSNRKYRENELNRFLDGVRLPSRSEWYLTTFIKDWCGDDGEYLQSDFDRDEPELVDEIRRVAPTVVVCLGRHVSRWFLGDVDLDETHAIPWRLPTESPQAHLFESPASVVVWANYSPAAGFRSPEISSAVAYDFEQLSAFFEGKVTARTLYDDQYPDPTYTEITSSDLLDECMAGGGIVAADTEGWNWNPWSVQLSTRAGEAYVIRTKSVELIARFVEWVNAVPDLYQFVFHAALHDLGVFRAMGIDVRRIHFDDTSIMAYNLQLEPLGLKPLCVRHCGMQMDSYDSIMGDAGTRMAQDWLMSVLEMEDYEHELARQAELDRLRTTPYTDAKGRTKPGRKIRALPTVPKSKLHGAIIRCLRSERPRKLWDDQVVDRHVEAGSRYGQMWEATLDHVEPVRAITYAARDADGTGRLEPALRERIRAAALDRVYAADLGTVLLIDRMQQTGITPDLKHFAALSGDLGLEIGAIQTRLTDQLHVAGLEKERANNFNANSSDQVGDLLFTRFGLPELKRTRGGDPSTNDRILEALEKSPGLDSGVRSLIADIRYYRETYKLKHTFVDQIPSFVDRWPFDGRIHATFRITRVVTGRLAASDPNLLAMPKYGKFAQRFREGFVSGDGRVFGSWDLSQIELRVLAHLSQDPVLLNAFRTGQDLHASLARRIFGVEKKDQTKVMRLAAKAINFGIPMGMTNIGLTVELKKNGVDVNEDDAQRWLDETMNLYALVPVYQQSKIAEAKRNGFVCDLIGRRRYVGGIRSFDPGTRSEAERFAFATPIQSSAQGVMKTAEAYLWNEIIMPRQMRGEWIEPILQVHDDVIMEFDKKLKADINVEMVWAMTKTFHGLTVPIETSGDWGRSWGHMEAF